MKDLNLVLFDLDGTLFRTETIEIYAINSALEANGFEPKGDDEILKIIGHTALEAGEMLLNTKDRVLIEKLINDVERFEMEAIEKSGELYEGTVDLLKSLKAGGLTLCVCSNGTEPYIKAIFNKFKLHSYFTEIWYYKEGITKSQAAGILKTKFEADSFIMIGDRSADINAAKETGGISIGAKYGFGPEEVATADYIAKSVKEIGEIVLKLCL
jgi:phosphoglycolate phosphatase